jgi:hypothetical protein
VIIGAVATTAERPRLDPPNILWFFGGLTAAAAGNAVVSRVHPSARGLWMLLAALAFLAVFAALSTALLRAGWTVPGGALRLVGFWRASGLAPLREYEGSAPRWSRSGSRSTCGAPGERRSGGTCSGC